jgi:hypothetical protein
LTPRHGDLLAGNAFDAMSRFHAGAVSDDFALQIRDLRRLFDIAQMS